MLARTAYGKAHGVEAGMDDKAWRERVPLRTYEGFAPHIERMKRGEADVLWPGRCGLFAVSSGTTAGPAKHLPVTDAMLAHFRKAGLDSLLYYAARAGASVFRGKHLVLGGPTTLAPLPGAGDSPAFVGDLSGILALNLPAWAERLLCEPGAEIAQMADWPARIEAIARSCADRDIRLLAGIPSWVLVLAAAVFEEHARRAGKKPRTLREVWPGFECLVHGGVPIGPFADELRAVCGPGVRFHEVYSAAEGFVAAQDAEPEAGLRLMADVGVYYEFIPLVDYDEARLACLGPRALPLEGVRAGVDYVLVMSTPAGLARYVIGDVVRFVSTDPARLVYTGRTRLRLGAFGEHVGEKQLTDALTAVCARRGWQVVNFHVAPVFITSLTGQKRGSHEWWIELRAGSEVNPTGPVMAPLLDAELRRLSPDYEARRAAGGLLPPTVRLVMPGVFEQWQRANGKWGGRNKMPRCRDDRQIADELAKYSPFHDAV
jgi:GH3 auxin-responsive promoter.